MSDAPLKVATVGAGRMGRGIAHVFGYAGHDITIVDFKDRPAEDAERLGADAIAEVAGTLGMMVEFGVCDQATAEAALARVSFAAADEAEAAIGAADLIFEGATETLAIKEDALRRMSAAARPDAIIASTTSTMVVDELAGFVTGPERFLNGHWLNPAFLIPLVEVSPGAKTDPAVTERFVAILEQVGKVPVVCGATPGFIVPRIQSLALTEAARMVEDGVASADEIDRATRVGFGLRFAILGLNEFSDWGGVDILYYANRYLSNALGERYTSPAIVDKLMDANRLGPRTGKGFYDYDGIDAAAYHRETLRKFVDLMDHMGLMAPAGGVPEGEDGPGATTRKPLKPLDPP